MNKQTTVLQLQQVSKRYQVGEQEVFALRSIDISIQNGEFVAIIGQSGSGKSTLLHIASLLDYPTQGSVIINGRETQEYSEKERARLRNKEIGFIFQQFNLLKKTSALANVALPLVYAGVSSTERHARASEMLQKVGLGERLNNTPAQLSGGQQQRVAIARALINNPSIVFADEPTGNLDSKSGKDITQLLTELHQEGVTIVMVTHSNEMAKIASRVVSMKDGEIISDRGQK